VVARRVRALAGVEVRIGDLRYEILSSRFVGRDIEAGPRASPYLRLPSLTVELALLSGLDGRTVNSIEASGARIAIASGWLGRKLRQRAHRALNVRAARLTRARIALACDGGQQIVLDGVDLVVSDLVLPPAEEGAPLRASGALRLKVQRVLIGSLVLEGASAEGKRAGDRLELKLRARGLGGKILLAGKVGLGSRIGPLELKGSADLKPAGADGPRVWGAVSLRGKSPSAVVLEGKLRSSAPLAARVGGRASGASGGKLEGPSLLQLRVRVGRRELRGTLDDWRLR
jgi:hypothetical protein